MVTDNCLVQGGMAHVRFQPRVGRYLAAAAANVVSILDVETQACRHSLQVSRVFSFIYVTGRMQKRSR